MKKDRFRALAEAVPGGRRYRLLAGDSPLSFRTLLSLWESDDDFCRWYSSLLSAADEQAFFWEHPPFVDEALDADVEFVLIEAPALVGERADPQPFAAHFAGAGDAEIAVFANLGGDALLIAPCPQGSPSAYPHLAAFLREGPAGQVRSLWRAAARACRRAAGEDPVWLSTSGLGVAWLHLRLDRFPKYYQHAAYKTRV